MIDIPVSNLLHIVADGLDDLNKENTKAFAAVEYSLAVDFRQCNRLLRLVNILGHKVIAIDIVGVRYRLRLCCQHIAAIEDCIAVALRQS